MSRVSLRFEDLEQSEFERYILTGNACEAFLDMRCIFEGNRLEIFYDVNGMKPLDQVLAGGFSRPAAILELCIDFLKAVRQCEDHLIGVQELSFADEDIFYSTELSIVRLRHIPKYSNPMSVREKLVTIADVAMEYYGGQAGVLGLLSAYKKRIYGGRFSLNDLIGITENCARSTRKLPVVLQDSAAEETAGALQTADKRSLEAMRQKMEQGIRARFKNFVSDIVS